MTMQKVQRLEDKGSLLQVLLTSARKSQKACLLK